jgi:uncharacterized DUF497 family protein
VKIEWDEEKRLSNARKHGIDFADVHRVFEGDLILIEDSRFEYTETRYIAFGLLFGRVIAVVYTMRGEVIRLISSRKASKYEERNYFDRLTHRSGPPGRPGRRRD